MTMILDRFKVDGGTVDSNWPFAMPSGLHGPKGD